VNPSAAQQEGSNANKALDGCISARVLLFDLDGTLADTAPDLAFALNRVLNSFAFPTVAVENTRNWIGNGMRRLLEQALADDVGRKVDPNLIDRGVALFESFYVEALWRKSVCYPGVIDGLVELKRRGYKMGCVTNKPRSCTGKLLEYSGLADFFEVVVSGDDLVETKPAPAPLLYAADQLRVDPKDCVMIGDSRNDIDAARAAGMAVLAVTWGYHQDLELSAMGATQLVSEFNQIFHLVTPTIPL
jgi:phosphoglycolate phosphatase